jgi:hypothetical protein
VSTLPIDLYARWRAGVPGQILREDTEDAAPPERLLQSIWYHQRLLRDRLETVDGKRVRVLHPGFWNHEAGPDFRGAVVQFDSEPPRSGDVEVDLIPGGWRAHGHEQNPAFQNVILHVVWKTAEKIGFRVPTLAVQARLDAPLAELLSILGARDMPVTLAGQCRAPLRDLPEATVRGLLRQAAQIRLQAKAAQFQSRARQAGWEQALWEGLFRALGYKQNVWPMQCLAELLPQLVGDAGAKKPSPLSLQARLLGAGGLLPVELPRAEVASESYLRRIWDCWWRERDGLSEAILPRKLWRFNGLRPANHPQRRLALAAHWLAWGNFGERLESWFKADIPEARLADSLLEAMQVGSDDFWTWHWTFRSAPMAKPQLLLGPQRSTDLAVNVILPWLWVRAAAGQNDGLQAKAEQRYFAWPPSEDNAVLRLARQRLLGGGKLIFRTAAEQQGLLQIVRDFCDHSNALCDNCRFPELVRGLQAD